MPYYTVTLAARPAGSSGPFENRTVKLRADVAHSAILAAEAQLTGAGLVLKADASAAGLEVSSICRMPDGYPDHAPDLGN